MSGGSRHRQSPESRNGSRTFFTPDAIPAALFRQ
jgi:hypothetical protein